MNRRTRLTITLAAMLPTGLGIVACGLLTAAGWLPGEALPALAIAALIQCAYRYLRLRGAAPITRADG